MTEQQLALIENFANAGKALKSASDSKSRKDNQEKAYNIAYKNLVRAGLAAKLKGKYNY